MRSLLLASVALTATLTSAFAPSIADACGGYMPDPIPSVFAVKTHMSTAGGPDHRSFVMLGQVERPFATWQRLAPDSFDPTQIAMETTTKSSTTMTLVGPSGSRVVSSNRRATVSRGWDGMGAFSALEVAASDDRFQIALAGTQPDAKWINVADIKSKASTTKWLEARGVAPLFVYTSHVDGTHLEVVSAHQDGQNGLISFVRIGNKSLGQYAGSAIGALEVGGKRYVLFENDGLITPAPV